MTIAVFTVAGSLALIAVMAWAQRRQLSTPALATPGECPSLSVLKPLKGVDPGLEANLESLFRQEYPSFEVLLGVAAADDPAVEVARRVAARHPRVPSRVIADARAVGLNPKVNNLANLVRHARGELILISDSNVRLVPGYVTDMVARLTPGVGLVSSPFRGVAGRGIGAAFEALHINTYVMGGVAAMHRVFRGVCVVGKSMLLRRETLDQLGGFEFLSGFLAEDQVCGEEVVRRGLRLELAALPVDNILGDLDLEAFVARHLRWAKIRLAMNPAGYAGEFLLNPVFLALIALALLPGLGGAALAATTVAIKTILDSSSERAAGRRRPLFLTFALVLAKDALIGLLWPVPLVSRKVSWRGNVLRIGRRTRVRRPPSLLDAPPTPLLESGSAA